MSDMKFTRKNILIIKGIRLSDIRSIDDMFDDLIIDNHNESILMRDADHIGSKPSNVIINEGVKKIAYKANPTQFTTVENWPQTSNCKCWHCDRYFESVPWCTIAGIAGNNAECDPLITNRDNFCGDRCAYAYLIGKYKGAYQREDMIGLFKIFYRRLTQTPMPDNIRPAAPKTRMVYYCGEMGVSSDEYNRL